MAAVAAHGEDGLWSKGLPKLNGVRFLRTGLLLGELKKKRFEPSQAFAMSLKKEEYANILDLSVQDERVIKYLKGEPLQTAPFACLLSSSQTQGAGIREVLASRETEVQLPFPFVSHFDGFAR